MFSLFLQKLFSTLGFCLFVYLLLLGEVVGFWILFKISNGMRRGASTHANNNNNSYNNFNTAALRWDTCKCSSCSSGQPADLRAFVVIVGIFFWKYVYVSRQLPTRHSHSLCLQKKSVFSTLHQHKPVNTYTHSNTPTHSHISIHFVIRTKSCRSIFTKLGEQRFEECAKTATAAANRKYIFYSKKIHSFLLYI